MHFFSSVFLVTDKTVYITVVLLFCFVSFYCKRQIVLQSLMNTGIEHFGSIQEFWNFENVLRIIFSNV